MPKPLSCPYCGVTDLVEVSDGVVQRSYFKWNGKHYIEGAKKVDTYGEVILECASCGCNMPYHKFLDLVKF